MADRIQIIIVTVVEYDLPDDPDLYPGALTIEDKVAADVQSAKDEPVLFMIMPGAVTTVVGHVRPSLTT